MSVQFKIPSGVVGASATAKTAIALSMGTNIPGEIIGITVSSSYTTAGTPVNLLVELGTATSIGTGTTGTITRSGSAQGTSLDTAKVNLSAEGTSPSILDATDLVLPAGPYPIQLPLGREFYLAVSTIYIIRVTSTAAVNCRVTLDYEV